MHSSMEGGRCCPPCLEEHGLSLKVGAKPNSPHSWELSDNCTPRSRTASPFFKGDTSALFHGCQSNFPGGFHHHQPSMFQRCLGWMSQPRAPTASCTFSLCASSHPLVSVSSWTEDRDCVNFIHHFIPNPNQSLEHRRHSADGC